MTPHSHKGTTTFLICVLGLNHMDQFQKHYYFLLVKDKIAHANSAKYSTHERNVLYKWCQAALLWNASASSTVAHHPSIELRERKSWPLNACLISQNSRQSARKLCLFYGKVRKSTDLSGQFSLPSAAVATPTAEEAVHKLAVKFYFLETKPAR